MMRTQLGLCRLALGLTLLLFTLPTLAAQPELLAGVKGGANLSWVTGADWEEDTVNALDGRNRGRFGATIGGFVDAVFPSGFGIRAELLYTEHGGKVADAGSGSDAELLVRAAALDVSILGERYFRIGSSAVSVFLGPTLLFIQGNIESELRFPDGSVTDEEPADSEQVLAASAGIGFVRPLGPGTFVVDARYTRGFTGYNDDDAYANAVTLLAGYGLPF